MPKKITKKQEKEIVDKIMEDKAVKDNTSESGEIKVDVKKSQLVAKESQGLEAEDEKVKASARLNGKFQAIALSGGRFRVINKFGQWISGFLNQTQATILASKFNMKDPEQKVRPPKKEGNWNEF